VVVLCWKMTTCLTMVEALALAANLFFFSGIFAVAVDVSVAVAVAVAVVFCYCCCFIVSFSRPLSSGGVA